MNIHEQIIAFLDGELGDESQVAELLHVLAVAPEKQRLLIDQVKLRRSYTTMGGEIASPLAADMAILRGLDAIDTGFPSPVAPPAGVTTPPASTGLLRHRPLLMGSVAALLITVGGVIGYLLGNGGEGAVATMSRPPVPAAAAPPAGARMASPADGSTRLVAVLRDSLVTLRGRYAALAASARVGRGGNLVNARQASRPAAPALSVERNVEETPIALAQDRSGPHISRADLRLSDRSVVDARDGTTPVIVSPALMERRPLSDGDLEVDSRVWQIGLRSNFRLSFPRVYGIEQRVNALTDREIVGTRRFDAGVGGLQMPLRLGVAVGGTQFSEVFHTNTGGKLVDTIIEQTPNFIYGRGFIAPEIIGSENWGASLELGAGGTVVGPFATLGLGLEYRALDRVSMDVGLSSWLLWTKLEQQAIMSTNLNAHVGAVMWFSFDEIFK